MTDTPHLTPRTLLAAAEACDRAAEAQTPEAEMRSVMEVWAYKEEIQLALLNQQLQAVAGTHRHQERLPLREDGEDTGVLTARIPKKLFFHLQQQRNFGLDGFCDEGGMKDFLKAFPQCRVKTISGKTTVGWRNASRETREATGRRHVPPRRFHFARGTLNLAT